MRCALCDGEYKKLKGGIKFHSRVLGDVFVPNLKYLECSSCGEKLVNPKEGEKATAYLKNEEQKRINRLSVSDFISATEASKLLGISKQAFSKHPKIKRGLIYSVQIGNRRIYHKRSVVLFKETGNGKFLLSKQPKQVSHRNIFITIRNEAKKHKDRDIQYRRKPISPETSIWEQISDVFSQWKNYLENRK